MGFRQGELLLYEKPQLHQCIKQNMDAKRSECESSREDAKSFLPDTYEKRFCYWFVNMNIILHETCVCYMFSISNIFNCTEQKLDIDTDITD